jgi:hypothetical protein
VGGGLTATLPGVDPVMDPESRAWVAALAEVLTDARRKLRAHLAEAGLLTGEEVSSR